MPFLNQQLNLINAHLRSHSLKDKRFQTGRFISLARLAVRNQGGTLVTMPVELNSRHEAAWVGIDDTYPLVVYHRKLGSQYAAVAKAEYGRGNPKLQETSDMLMVVYGKAQRLQLSASELEAQIVSGFPDNMDPAAVKDLGLTMMLVSLAQSTADSETVFAAEYKNVDFRLAPEDILLSVRYTITTQFNKNCYDFCCGNAEE